MTDYLDMPAEAASGGCWAFVVSSNGFQNALLSDYIAAHTPWKCSVVESLAAIPLCGDDDAFFRRVILCDCFRMSGDDLKDSLLTELQELPAEWMLILFNLDRQTGIERSGLEIGVHGFFYRDDAVGTLLKGLAAVIGGEIWVSRQKLAEVIDSDAFRIRHRPNGNRGKSHGLTRREVETLDLLGSGATNEVIAEKLFISPNTVRTHLNHIFRKIKVSNRLEASNWASEYLFGRDHE